MARTVIALGAGIVGGLIGGPLGASIGFSLGNFVGGILFGSDAQPITTTGPQLNDTSVSTSVYGKGIPIFEGGVRIGGNMIWATEIQEVRTEEVIEGDSGNFYTPDPPDQIKITFTYFGNFAMAFGEGPGFVRRIFADGKLIVDLSDQFAVGQSNIYRYGGARYRIYDGTETQGPDSLIEADKGVGNVPGFRGMIYVVFDSLPLKDFGNRIPQISAEVVNTGPSTFTSINDSVNPGGGNFGRDSDYFDQSGRTTLGYNTNTHLTVFSYVSRNQVLRVAVGDLTGVRAAMTEAGLTPALTFFNDSPFVDPNDGMLVLPMNSGNPGGTCVYIGRLGLSVLGVLDQDAGKLVGLSVENPLGQPAVARLIDGRWQCIRPEVGSQYEFSRVYKIAGQRFFFGAAGLTNHLRLEATPFFDLGYELVDIPFTFEVMRTAPTRQVDLALSGTAIPDDVVTGTGNDWFNAAYDPVIGRAWFITDANEIVIFADGAFGSLLDLNTVLDPVHTTGGTFSVQGIAYDKANEVLIVVCDDDHFTINPTTYAVIQSAGPNTPNPISDAGPAGHTGGFTSNLWANQETVDRFFREIPTSDDLAKWTTNDLTVPVNRYLDGQAVGDTWIASEGPLFIPAINAFYTTLGTGTWGFMDRLSNDGLPLSTLVNRLVARTGVLTASDTDVVDIAGDTVRGYLVENPATIRSMIEPLQAAFFFDGAEIDGTLVFKKRTGTSTQTITSDELGAKPAGTEAVQNLDEPRKQETEVPRKVDVSYMNINNDYQIGTQRDQRIQDNPAGAFTGITRSRQTAVIRLPIVMSDQEARDVASVALASAWVERTSLEFTLPPKFMRLDPTDIITIQKITTALTADLVMRITQIEMGAGGILNVSGLLTETAVFQPNVTAQIIDGTPAGPIPFPVGTNLFLLNLPNLLGNLDNTGSAWWGASPDIDTPNPAWEGSNLFRALEADGPQTLVDATFTQLKWGLLRTELLPPPDNGGGRNFTTRERTLTTTVDLQSSGTLASISDLSLFDGGNFAYIPETGELFQYQNATLDSEENYVLDTMLRGRLGTEIFVADTGRFNARTAIINSEIIFLGINLAAIHRFSSAAERGLTRFYEANTLGGLLGTAGRDAEDFINTSASLLPLSPSDFEGTRDGSDNIDLTWLRRDRFNHELLDLADVPLNEQGEVYEVDVVDRPEEDALVLRTFTGLTTELLEYIIAEQQTDVLHSGDFPLSLTGDLQNDGFEEGGVAIAQANPPTIPGWPVGTTGTSENIGNWGVRSAALGSIAAAQAGTFFMYTTLTVPSILYNTSSPVLLTGLATPLNLTELDNNLGRFQITINGQSAQGDGGGTGLSVETYIQARFFDRDDVLISFVDGTASGHSIAGTWEARTVGPVNIPVGTRSITVRLYSDDVPTISPINIGWDAITMSLTDTASGTVQRFSFDVFQLSDTVGRGRGRRTVAPAVGQ